MARARNIKPGFFKNEELAELGPFAMLLFEGLWCLADKAGRLEDRPKRIKAEIFPYFAADVDTLLDGLADRGFILRYTVDRRCYIQVVNWHHQRPHSNETKSVIPPPAALPIRETGRSVKEDSAADQGDKDFVLIPDTLNTDSLIPDTGLPVCACAREAAPPPPRSPPKAIRKKSPTALPPDWDTDQTFLGDTGLYAWAKRELAMTPERVDFETDKFMDHFHANGDTKIDWLAAWRNWMRRSSEPMRTKR